MSAWKKLASAAAATGDTLDVDDVFKPFCYIGNGSNRTLDTGIDFSTEGGMVWFKDRSNAEPFNFYDTVRGATKSLRLQSSIQEATISNGLTAFTTSGFSLGNDSDVNTSGADEYVAWCFRKKSKFFTIASWTGDGTGSRTISHDLGSTVGFIMMKERNSSLDWSCFHRHLGGTKVLNIGSTSIASTSQYFNNYTPTSSDFQVSSTYNTNGNTYIAYIYAHNDGDGDFGDNGDQDIIKCGGYTGTGLNWQTEIDIGFEPQFVMIKNTSVARDWVIIDTMRGMTQLDVNNLLLRPNLADNELDLSIAEPTLNGFLLGSNYRVNTSGNTYIYVAIRRPGVVTPSDASNVFDTVTYTSNNTDKRVVEGLSNNLDFIMARNRNNVSSWGYIIGDRTQHRSSKTSFWYRGSAINNAQTTDTDSYMGFDYTNGFKVGNDSTRRLNYVTYTQVAHTWTRAKGFFDIVTYEGVGGTSATIDHTLGVVPEMIWVKNILASQNTAVYHKDVHATSPEDYVLAIEVASAVQSSSTAWNSTAPTATTFSVGNDFRTYSSGGDFVAYLFASVAGVSKVGGYTGNGTSQNIDCGFSSGAKFVLIKKVDDTSSWFVFDSERGIVAGNDPYLTLDGTQAEDTNQDFLDPFSSGFAVNGSASSGTNASGGKYIYYAVA